MASKQPYKAKSLSMISICIPVYNFDISLLINALSNQLKSIDAPVELIVIDDCSTEAIKTKNRISCKDCQYIELPKNIGRSKIRNLFLNYASHDYLLFLDCDSLIENFRFLSAYIEVIAQAPAVVCGGRYYGQKPAGRQQKLRWKYGVYKESQTCESRKKQPYKSFMSNNFLISRKVLEEIKFDERITQYGHEDTLFGYSLKKRQIPISHIDNPVLNGDIETNAEYLRKTREGIINLVAILNFEEYQQDLINDITLLRFYNKIRKFESLVLWFFLIKKPVIIYLLTRGYVSLRLFNFYKLGILIEHRKKQSRHKKSN